MADAKKERAPIAVVLIGLLVLLPILYVASYGPAFYFLNLGYYSPESFDWFYAPILWVSKHSPTVKAMIIDYQELCRP